MPSPWNVSQISAAAASASLRSNVNCCGRTMSSFASSARVSLSRRMPVSAGLDVVIGSLSYLDESLELVHVLAMLQRSAAGIERLEVHFHDLVAFGPEAVGD